MPQHLLWEHAPEFEPAYGQAAPALDLFLLNDGQPHGLVIVMPGGAYKHLAPHEGAPIAAWLNSAGFSAAVLTYRVAPYRLPIPWLDASRAVRTVRSRAAEWNIRPDKIGVLGFSAGGHLAATIATRWDGGDPTSADPIERVGSRPDAAVLCYAVLTFVHPCSHALAQDLLGAGVTPEQCAALSPVTEVASTTPPTFLWSTADDPRVPVGNSLVYSEALRQSEVPFALHVFPHGRHGLGLAAGDPVVGQWTTLCAVWLRQLGF